MVVTLPLAEIFRMRWLSSPTNTVPPESTEMLVGELKVAAMPCPS
jgi:hypothetical protein